MLGSDKSAKFNIPVNMSEIIKAKSHDAHHLPEMLAKDVAKSIVNDEYNNFKFYDIPKVYNEIRSGKTEVPTEGKRVITFHSVHSM